MITKGVLLIIWLTYLNIHELGCQVIPGVRNVLVIIMDDMRPELGVYRGTDNSLYPGNY